MYNQLKTYSQLMQMGGVPEGAPMPQEQQIPQGQPPMQQAPQQGGGGDPMEEVIEMVMQAMQQGASPEQVVQSLVQQGIPQEQAVQVVQMVMQEMQGGQGGQGAPQGGGQPQMMTGGTPKYQKAGTVKYKPLSNAELSALAHEKRGMGSGSMYGITSESYPNNIGYLTPREQAQLQKYMDSNSTLEKIWQAMPNLLGEYGASNIPKGSRLYDTYERARFMNDYAEQNGYQMGGIRKSPMDVMKDYISPEQYEYLKRFM